MGLAMAAGRRHWKEKSGRFYARIAVPKALVPVLGKTELIESLGGDRRAADRAHAAAVARLMGQIAQTSHQLGLPANRQLQPGPIPVAGPEDIARLVWAHHEAVLRTDDQTRLAMPTMVDFQAEHDRLVQRIGAGELDGRSGMVSTINAYTDYELMLRAREDDHLKRERRLGVLRSALASGDTRLVEDTTRRVLEESGLWLQPGTPMWIELAQKLMRAEIQALSRTLKRDQGDYAGKPADPVVREPEASQPIAAPVQLCELFEDYIVSRQRLGKHRDGARRWEAVIEHLVDFLDHGDARRITKRNLIDWRDKLVAEGRSAKTVADVYLASVRAILRWAFENDRLPENVAGAVRQEVPRRVKTRERGYTDAEAVKVLQAALCYRSGEANGSGTRESPRLAAAKRWLPFLCAFTGARVTEMAQLRKEDVRQEGAMWVIRITPEAGSVKTGEYRDVPLHRQVLELGIIEFVAASKPGPLFHSAERPERYLSGARTTAGRLSQWLQANDLVPDGVQPSHGWRHRFKTLGRELALSDRVIDAIQGHASKTAGDGYGDVTLAAKHNAIEALPDYPIKAATLVG